MVTSAPSSCLASASWSSRSGMAGLFGNRELGQGQAGVGGVGAERMQGLEALAAVVGAPRRLAVDGDEVVAIRPKRGDPAFETAAEEDGIDAVDEGSQPAFAGNAKVELRKTPEKAEMVLTPGRNLVDRK